MKIKLLTLIALGILFTQCRKGDEDPFLSLRTRKARLAGSWVMESYNAHETTYHSNGTKEEIFITETGGKHTFTNNYTGPGGSSAVIQNERPGAQSIEIEKDGTYSWNVLQDSENMIYGGNWIFLGKSDQNELRKKEGIAFTVRNFKDDDDDITVSGMSDNMIFTLKRLSNKEMIWVANFSRKKGNGSSTYEETYVWKLK